MHADPNPSPRHTHTHTYTPLHPCFVRYPEYSELLSQSEVLSPLLRSLRSSNSELKAKACAALVALTSSSSGREQLRAAGGIDPLLEVLLAGGGAPELWENVCTVLANLLDDDTDEWKRISQAGAVFSLAAQLGTSSLPLQESILTLLALLCAHPECREQAADAACIPHLVRHLGSSRPSVGRCALALVQQLVPSRRACDSLLESGAAAPLASMLSTSAANDSEVASAILESLSALSRSGVTQAQTAVRNAGAVPQLIQMMSHSHPRCVEHPSPTSVAPM